MNEELLQKVYDKTGLEQNGFSFNQFKQGLSNDEFVQSVFDKSGLSDNGFNINQFKSVINEDGNLPEASPTRTEEQNYLDGWLGNIEFIDDMARAWGQGKVDRQVVEKTGALLEGGGAEDIDNYLQAVQNQQNAPVSDEYRKFEKDLADNDKGLVGVMQTLGDIWNNKSATSEILVRSVSSMFNKDAAKLGAAGALAGTAIPIIGTGVGAMWGVSTATESMMSLSNLIQEELGGNLTEENVKGLLEDKEKFNDLKNKALLRGFTIGTFDAVAGGIGSALGAKMASKVGKAFTTTGTELVGAFTGELAGQKAEGKEFDLTEATLEAFADPTAPFVIGKTTFFDPVAKRIRNKKESTYTINNGKADRKTVSDLIKAAQSKEDLEGITVANDSELEAELSERFEELRFGEDIPSSVADEDKQRIIELQKERTKLGDTDAGEIRKAQIKKEITELLTKKQEDAIQKDVKKEDAKKEDQPSEEGDAGKKEQEEVVIPEGDVLPQVEPKEGQEAVGDRFANPAAKTKEFKELSVEYKEKGSKFEDGINDADFKLQNIVEEKVPVASIVPTQTTLTTQAIEKPKTAGKPLLIKTDNGYFIEDGHHRIAKQIAEGVTDIDAEVYDPTAAAPIAKETYKKRKEKETQDIKDTTQKEIDDTTQSIDKTIEERDQLVTDIESLYRDVENALEEYEIIPDNATGKRAERRNSPIQKFVKSLGDTAKLNKALTALAGIKKEKAKKKGKDVGEIKLTIGDLPRQIPTDLRRKVVDLYNSKTEKNKSLRELQDKRDTATKRASDLEAQPQPEATAEEVAPMVKPPSLTTDEVSANAKIIDDNRFTRNPETGSLVKGGRKGKGKTPSKIATALSSLMTNVSKAFGKKPSELVPAIGTTTIEGAKELAEETVSDFRTSIEQDSNAPGGITLEKAIERNNGNPLSQTPDGKESKLYKDILTLPEIDGDTAKADKFKAQIYSDNFKNWFGDWQGSDKSNVSKVVDENGEPLMVYHGTPNGRFDIFDISKFGQRDEGFFGKGFYFAFDRYTAEFYASNEYSDSDGDILPVFLNIKNPLQDSESFIESLSSYTEITPINKELFNQIFKAVNSIREKKGRPKLQQTESTYNRYAINEYTGKPGTMQEILKGLGDALEISMEMGHDGIVSTQSFDDNQIVISNPNQIKSVFNNGQFSQTDNNIKLSQEGAPQNLEQFVDQVSTMMGTLKSMLPQIDNAIRLSKDAAEKKRLKEKKEIIKNIILEHSSKGKIEAKYSREGVDKLPETITHGLSSILNNKQLKGKTGGTVSTGILKQIANSKQTQPIQQDIINEVLGLEKFAGKKKIDYIDFLQEVSDRLLPLELIESESYKSYGKDNTGLESVIGDDQTKTHIYNTTLEHGVVGHFRGDFPDAPKQLSVEETEIIYKESRDLILERNDSEYILKDGDRRIAGTINLGNNSADGFINNYITDASQNLITKILSLEVGESLDFTLVSKNKSNSNNGIGVYGLNKSDALAKATNVLSVKDNFVPLEIRPLQDNFAVVRSDVVLTEDNIAENVLTVTSDRAKAQEYIDNVVKAESTNKGMLGHTRVWEDSDGNVYVAEMQSDSYQRQRAKDLLLKSYQKDPSTMNDKQRGILGEDSLGGLVESYDSIGYLNRNIDDSQSEDRIRIDNQYLDNGIIEVIPSRKLPISFSQEIVNGEEAYVAEDSEGFAFITRPVSAPGSRSDFERRVSKMAESGPIPFGWTLRVDSDGKYYASKPNNLLDVFSGFGEVRTDSFNSRDDLFNILYPKEGEKDSDYSIRVRLRDQEALLDYNLPPVRGARRTAKNSADRLQKILDAASLKDKQFLAHEKNYTERLLREEIRRAANKGAKTLSIPTPRTLALIEGYISDNGSSEWLIEGEDNQDRDIGANDIVTDSEGNSWFVWFGDDTNFNATQSFEAYEQYTTIENETGLDSDEYTVFKDFLQEASDILGFGDYQLQNDGSVVFFDPNVSTQFSQPSATKDSSDFNISEMSDAEQTVLKKYEKLVKKFNKERPDAKIKKDSKGNEWVETKITDQDVNNPSISFSQENSKYYGAALQSLQGTVILALTKNPGPSTFVHELFHAAEVLFNDSQKQFLVNQYNKWAKNKKGFPQAKNYGDLKNIKGKAGSRKGEPVVSEWAARAYEQYFTAGRDIDAVDGANNMSAAEKSTLKNILDTIHEAIKSIGQTIKQYLGEDITLSDEMVKFFDDITAGRNPKINEQVKTTKTEGAKDGAETVPEVQTEEGGVQEPEVSKQTFVDEINADREAKGQKPISIDKGGVFKKSDGTNYSKTTQDKFNKQFDAWKKEKLLAAGKIALKRGRLDRKVVRRMGSLRKSLSGKLTKRKGFFGPVKEILDKDTTKNLFNVRTQVTELINLPLHRLADKELADQIINTLKKLNESKGPIYAEIGDISKLVADAKKDLEVLNVDKITTVDSAASSVRTFIKAAQSMLATDIDMRNVGSLIRRVTNKLESIERLRDKLDQLESEYKSGSAEDKAKLEKIKKLRSDLSAIELPLLKKDLYAPDIVDSIEAQVDADIKNWTKDIESDSGLDFKPSPMERRQLDTLLDYLDNISETGYELDLKDKINIHDTLSSIRLAGIMPYSRFSAINRLSAKASANSKSNQNIADAIRKQYLDNDSFFGKMGRFLDPSKRLKINLGDAINQFRNLSTSLWPSKLLAGTDGYISKQLADMQSRQAEDGRDTGNTLQDIASKFVKLSKDANKTLTQNLRGTMAQLRGNKAKTSRVKIGMLLSERMFKTRYGEDFSNWGVVMKTQIDQLDNTPSVGFGNDYWSERKVYKEAFKDLVLDSEGNVDIEASVKKLSKAERAQFDFVTDFLNNNPEYLEKQEITAALNGMVFNVVDNYFPLLSKSRGIKSSAKDDSKGTLVNPILNQPKLISDRLKSAGDATPKLVEADVFNVLMDYVNQTNRDYYVAESVRGARTFFNESIKNANAEAVDSRSAREGFVTNMYIAMNTALESSLLDSYGIKKSNKLIDTILTGTYVDFLTGLERVSITEVLSEIPRSSIGGEINRQAFNAYWKEKVSSIRNIYKTGANKGTGVSFNLEGEVVMTKKVENNLRKLLRITRAPFLDTFNRMLTDSDADVLPKSRLGEARDYLLGFSNRATLYGQWMPAFNNAFREYTKENIDYSKLDDKEYLRKHRRAIKKAGEFANIETAKFRGLSRGIGEPTVSMALGFYPIDKNTSPTWFKVNRFMAAFGFRQATNVITSLQDVLMYAMFKGKDAPQTLGKAGRTIIAEAASGVIYGVVAQIMTNVTTYALLSLRDEEDLTEWEKEKLSALEEDLLGETDLFNELMGTLVFFTASKLGAAGRGLALIAAGLRVGNLEKKMRNAPTKAEKDRLEEEIAEINTLTKTFFYSSPVNLNQYGKYSTPLGIAKLFPFLALPADITEDFMEAESLRLDKDLNDVEQGEAFLLQAYNVAQMAMLLSGNVPPAISSAEKYVFGINKRKAKLKESAKGDNNKDKKSLKPKSLKGDL